MSHSTLSLINEMLRDPASLVDRMDGEGEFAAHGPRLLALIVVGAGLFGAVVGTYRGGLQVAFAAAKMPVLVLLPGLVLLPALQALWALSEVTVSLRRLSAAALVGSARTAVLAAALGPILWLAWPGLDYHWAILWFVGALSVAGAAGLSVVLEAAPATGKPLVVRAVALVLLGVLSMQSGWMLRPFVVRPGAETTWVRTVEDDVFTALGTTVQTAVYGRSPR